MIENGDTQQDSSFLDATPILYLDEIQQRLHSAQYLSCNCNSLSATFHTVWPHTRAYPKGCNWTQWETQNIMGGRYGRVHGPRCFCSNERSGRMHPCNRFRQVVSCHAKKLKWCCSRNYANPCSDNLTQTYAFHFDFFHKCKGPIRNPLMSGYIPKHMGSHVLRFSPYSNHSDSQPRRQSGSW